MKLQLIVWADHFSGCDDAWHELSDLRKSEPKALQCHSVGWVAHENDKLVTLIANLDGTPTERDAKGFGTMHIIKQCIVKRVTLKGA